MSEQKPYRMTIPPVSDETPRPLWSVMIPTYNCANYLREALASVLAQDPGSDFMQIEVVDDHSTQDDPAAVVEELGQGRVGFYRQVKNVGYISNFETCLKRSRGHLIHLLHGDDYVRIGFYRRLQQAFEENPEIGAAYCRHIIMDENGHWQRLSPLEQPESGILKNGLERIVARHPIQTPSIVVRREVYERLGGFDRRMSSCGEDWEMWVRIATQYPFWFEVEPLAVYRAHASSLSGQAVRTGQNIRDVCKATEIITSYLPETTASRLSTEARELWAFCGLHYAAHQLLARRDVAIAVVQLKEALKCSHSFRVIVSVLSQLLIELKEYWLWQTERPEAHLTRDTDDYL
jgi:glycosyltransferase involved in cell wall biosynthesis